MKNFEVPMDTFESVEFTHPMVKEGFNQIKRIAEEMEDAISTSLSSPRHRAIVMTKLEEVVLWAGKGFANDQKQINLITEEGTENYDTTSNL